VTLLLKSLRLTELRRSLRTGHIVALLALATPVTAPSAALAQDPPSNGVPQDIVTVIDSTVPKPPKQSSGQVVTITLPTKKQTGATKRKKPSPPGRPASPAAPASPHAYVPPRARSVPQSAHSRRRPKQIGRGGPSARIVGGGRFAPRGTTASRGDRADPVIPLATREHVVVPREHGVARWVLGLVAVLALAECIYIGRYAWRRWAPRSRGGRGGMAR
jgi:hypothetical protein